MDESKPYVMHRYEDFHVLSLEILKKNSLDEALEFFIQPDKLTGENAYFCEQYQCKLDASKHAMLEHLPPILAVHLKRFTYSPVKNTMEKVHDKLVFPQTLSLERFTVEDETDPSPSRFQYKLRGVIVHSGECQSGHYYSFINTTSPYDVDPSTGKHRRQWFKFNDSEVDYFSDDQLEQQCFGGKKTEVVTNQYGGTYNREVPKTFSAYMLFYERCDMIDDGNDEDFADVDDSALLVGDPAVEAEPAPAASAAAEETNTNSPQTAFVNLPCAMNAENIQFIHQRFLNSPSLFSFLYYLWTQTQQLCDPRALAQMFLDVICRSFAKDRSVSVWANYICTLAENNRDFAAWYLNYVISEGVIENHVLPSSPSELVRVKVTDTIVSAMKAAAPVDVEVWSKDVEKCALILKLKDRLFELLRPCREHWQTFNQYFHLFYEYAKLGPQARVVLMEADIASLFSGWFFGRSYTVKVVSTYNFPDLRDFFNTLETIWCGCFQGPNEDSSSPYASDKTLVKPLARFKNELFLSDFFPEIMRHPYNPQAIAHMACHWCYNDVEATNILMSYCVQTLELPYSARKCTMLVVNSVLDVPDDLHNARLNIFMTPYRVGSECGLLGALQAAHSRVCNSLFYDMEHLNQCCKHDFGFALALESRGNLNWLDGCFVNKLRIEMQKKPTVFERLCLQGDPTVLQSAEGREFAETNAVKAFFIFRSIIERMDNLDAKHLEHYRSVLIESRMALLKTALEAARNNRPYIMQPEWRTDASLVECGRSSSATGSSKGGSSGYVVSDGSFNDSNTMMDDYDPNQIKNSINATNTPSESEIAEMVKAAKDISGADEAQIRSLLTKNNYNVDQVVTILLGLT